MVPVLAVFLFDVEVAEANLVVFRNVDLNVASRTELQVLAFGQLDDEFLDKGRHIAVRNHLALPFLDAEDGFGNLDLHIFLYLDLTTQTPFLGLLPTREEVDLSGQNVAAALEHLTAAHAARSAAAASRREENSVVTERREQRAAGLDGQLFFSVVDVDTDLSGRSQFRLGIEQQNDQQERYYEKCRDCYDD